MRHAFCLFILLAAAVILQLVLFPALLPPVLRPDAGILLGMAVLAFSGREFGLITLFTLGVQADLFGSERFGLLTLCYLLAAGLILLLAWRELTRGDVLAAWAGGLAGTALAHGLYCVLGRIIGLEISFGGAFAALASLLIATVVWGLPSAYLCGKLLYRAHAMSQPVQSRWAAEARLAAAKKGRRLRA